VGRLPVAADPPDRPPELVVAPQEVARQFADDGESGRQRDDAGRSQTDRDAGDAAQQARQECDQQGLPGRLTVERAE